MALVDRFLVNKKEFQVVALAPFIFISASLITLLFLNDTNWALTITGTLLTHMAMCSGDFGLLSYFEYHNDKEVVAYDDIKNGMSYFYAKTK